MRAMARANKKRAATKQPTPPLREGNDSDASVAAHTPTTAVASPAGDAAPDRPHATTERPTVTVDNTSRPTPTAPKPAAKTATPPCTRRDQRGRPGRAAATAAAVAMAAPTAAWLAPPTAASGAPDRATRIEGIAIECRRGGGGPREGRGGATPTRTVGAAGAAIEGEPPPSISAEEAAGAPLSGIVAVKDGSSRGRHRSKSANDR